MARAPERAILRAFCTLGVQNLLYPQAEMDELEKDLRLYRKMEDEEGFNRSYATDWGWWTSDERRAFTQPKQYEVGVKIPEKLKEYGMFER
jgi:hypothetical protein